MKRNSILIIFLHICLITNAQKWADKVNPWKGLNGIQLSVSGYENIEAGVNYVISSSPKEDPGFGALAGFQNISVGLGASGNKKQVYFGPHVSYQRALSMLSLQAALDYHTSIIDGYLRFSPKVGLSFYGFANVVWGYNFYLSNTNHEKTQPNFTISAQMTILNKH